MLDESFSEMRKHLSSINVDDQQIAKMISLITSCARSDEIRKLLMSTVLSVCRPRIVYLGPEGSFTHEVATLLRGDLVPVDTISDVFRCVSDGTADIGVVPLENSLEGIVNETVDCFVENLGVYIVQCIEYKVSLCLAVSDDVRSLEDIKVLYAHPHALSQARSLISRLRGVEIVYTSSTSRALDRVKSGRGAAAIASRYGIVLRGLRVLLENVEDRPSYTRFVVIGRSLVERGERTSMTFIVDNRPGALYRAIEPFSRHNINISMIYSRPTRMKPWEYYFYMEVECSLDDERCRRAIEEFRERTRLCNVLGSYFTIRLHGGHQRRNEYRDDQRLHGRAVQT